MPPCSPKPTSTPKPLPPPPRPLINVWWPGIIACLSLIAVTSMTIIVAGRLIVVHKATPPPPPPISVMEERRQMAMVYFSLGVHTAQLLLLEQCENGRVLSDPDKLLLAALSNACQQVDGYLCK